jgi:chromosome segregation ATPase
VQSSHAARVHELQSALIKLEEDLKHALITISELEKEQTLLKGDLAQSNNQLQRRTQDTILLDKEYTNLLKEYDLISRDKSFLQADN